MFKMIKMTIVLGLIVGVIILGTRINQKSSEIEKELAAKKSQVHNKISEIKKEIKNKTTDLGNVYEKLNKMLDEGMNSESVVQTRKQAPPDKISKINFSNKKEFPIAEVSLDPIDEEDRKLTEEILKNSTGENEQSEKAWNIAEIYRDASNSQVSMEENERFSPMDLNRVTEIRNLYLKAIETLNLE